MSHKKQFGVWMDSQHASIVGNQNEEDATFSVLAHVKGESISQNSNEHNANNHEKTVQAKFFKEISAHLLNATHVHVTGTGQIQEQFINFLADTPASKNVHATESTSNKMSDEKLVEYITEKF